MEDVARRLLGPLLDAQPRPGGLRVVAWDAEQGLQITVGKGDRTVLVELEARDEAQPCFAHTTHFNVCARPLFTRDPLTAEERAWVLAFVRFLRAREHLVVVDRGSAPRPTELREIEVSRMLVAEGPGRYYLNAYAGCMIGCSFCFVAPRAELSRRLEGSPPPAWGRWVDVKTNAAEVLRREIEAYPPGLVRMSPILTDPYQGAERKYRITRQCLDVLMPAGFVPMILTRQSRALDDLERLARGPSVVGFSIPTNDERLREIFEPKSDSLANRVQALRTFAQAGITTAVVVQPALPMDVDAFVDEVAPWVRAVQIDRMHFEERVRAQYVAAGLEWAMDAAYQAELVQRLDAAFSRAGVHVERSDDLAGTLGAMLTSAPDGNRRSTPADPERPGGGRTR